MLRSLWIKIPTVLLSIGAFVALDGWLGVVAGTAICLLGVGLIGWLTANPNSSVWVKTLWKAPRSTDTVALTFDDGPDPRSTLKIAEILNARGIRGTFFVVGDRVRKNPEIVEALHAQGHLVANHSDSHANSFHFRLWGGFRRELEACNRAIRESIGLEPAIFRAPQGIKNPALCDVLRELDLAPIGWQVRGLDSMSDDADAIERRVLSGAKPGGVIMLHDGGGYGGLEDRSATIEALPRIIDGLEARGLRFVRLDELLELEAYRPAPAAEPAAA